MLEIVQTNVDKDISFLSTLFLIPIEGYAPSLSVSWTLMHEFLFYSVFLSFYLFRSVFKYLLLSWVFLILLSNTLFLNENFYINFLLSPYNLQFLFGLFVGFLVVNSKIKPHFNLIIFITFLTLIFCYILQIVSLSFLSDRIFYGLVFSMILLGIIKLDSKINYQKILLFLGASSYSIYLVHNPALSIFNRIFHSLNLPYYIDFVAVSVLSIIIGILYFLLYERPVMNFLRKKSL